MIAFFFLLNVAAAGVNIFLGWPGVGSDSPLNLIAAVLNAFVAGLLFDDLLS